LTAGTVGIHYSKTLAAATENVECDAAQIAERLKRPQEGLNNPLVAGRYRYVMRLVGPFLSATD